MTFEIDLSGNLDNFNDWTDGTVKRNSFGCCETEKVTLPSFLDVVTDLFKAT